MHQKVPKPVPFCSETLGTPLLASDCDSATNRIHPLGILVSVTITPNASVSNGTRSVPPRIPPERSVARRIDLSVVTKREASKAKAKGEVLGDCSMEPSESTGAAR